MKPKHHHAPNGRVRKMVQRRSAPVVPSPSEEVERIRQAVEKQLAKIARRVPL